MYQYTSKDIERFWSKVNITDNPDDCWEWQAYIHWKGYGQFTLADKQRTRRSHRVAYELSFGEIPNGIQVCHKCDNRKCCNPNHLFLGTAKNNTDDMVSKNRQFVLPTMPGESHPSHKLTEEQVGVIRARYAHGGITHRQLALEMGVSKTLITAIISGKAWK